MTYRPTQPGHPTAGKYSTSTAKGGVSMRTCDTLSSIVYKCIHGAAPSYLMNLCVPVATNTSRRYLRPATHGDLLVPRMRMVTYGSQSFAVSGPTVWNMLPSTLRASTTIHSGSFRVD